MRTFLIILPLMILFGGCAHKSAFESFKISPEQARSEDMMQSSKIENNGKVIGIVSAVYLNKVEPKIYKSEEVFYITVYVKKDFSQNLEFYLNKQKPLSVQKLSPANKFTKLTGINADWFRYYLVKFKRQNSLLRLVVTNKTGTSQALIFHKDE